LVTRWRSIGLNFAVLQGVCSDCARLAAAAPRGVLRRRHRRSREAAVRHLHRWPQPSCWPGFGVEAGALVSSVVFPAVESGQ
jgi:hypothetical protein